MVAAPVAMDYLARSGFRYRRRTVRKRFLLGIFRRLQIGRLLERLKRSDGLMPRTVQNRQCRISLEARVRETEPALIKDRAVIGPNEAYMTRTLTKPDVFAKVFHHTVSLSRAIA